MSVKVRLLFESRRTAISRESVCDSPNNPFSGQRLDAVLENVGTDKEEEADRVECKAC